MKSIEQKIIRFITENNLLKSEDRILVALSGGPDSVFLLHFLNKFKKKYKIEIGAVHINHLLRGKDSERDVLFCKAICDELSIPFYLLKKNIKTYAKSHKTSLEVAGRKVRYTFFEKVVQKNNYNKIATAHNANDNTETVFLNLIKGTGIKGISGIPVKRGNIIRPMLSLIKKEILEYLEENEFEYRIDRSNLSNDFERNYLRNEVIPLIQKNVNPALSQTVLNSSLNLQSLILGIEKTAEKMRSYIESIKNTSVLISQAMFSIDNEFIVSYALKQNIDENFSIKIESIDLKKILSLKNKQTGKSEELTGNLIAFKERNKILIKKATSIKKRKNIKLKIGEEILLGEKKFSIKNVKIKSFKTNRSKNIEYISGDGIKDIFSIREWKKGDKFYPLGMKGSKNISDYLNDIKVESSSKKSQLILTNSDKIVWVIGSRLDDRFKLNSKTKKVLKLCLK